MVFSENICTQMHTAVHEKDADVQNMSQSKGGALLGYTLHSELCSQTKC